MGVEYDNEVEFTPTQRALYNELGKQVKEGLARQERTGQRIKRGAFILNALNKMRLICGHPATMASSSNVSKPLRAELEDRTAAASGKTARLMEILTDVLPLGEKILIFVMRKTLLYLLKEIIETRFPSIDVLTYCGDLAIADRPARERRFHDEKLPGDDSHSGYWWGWSEPLRREPRNPF